jgi:threonine/homoserine/homoserine lactone efflux protein
MRARLILGVVSEVIIGFGLGLVIAAQLGPVSLLIIRAVLRGGLAIGLAMAVGVALIDVCYAIVGLAGAGAVLAADGARFGLGLAGSVVLIVIGARTVWAGFRARVGAETAEELGTPGRAFATALAATALNPLAIALWTGAFLSALAPNNVTSLAHEVALLIGVGFGTLTWYTAFSTALALLRRRVGPRLSQRLDVAVGSGLVAFGGLLGYRAVRQH